MNGDDVEKLLGELSLVEESRQGTTPADEALRAYREGALTEGEARAVETLLAESSAARKRLAELAGVDLPAPAPGVRDAVLRRLPRAARPQPTRLWRGPALGALAAGLALAFGLWLFMPRNSGDALSMLPTGSAFSVGVTGYRPDRNSTATASESEAQAFPDTRVEIKVKPEGAVASWVGFGLYRRDGNRLIRLNAELEVARGAAVFTARAAGLVGSQPGDYELYVVVAGDRGLARFFTLEPGADPVAAVSVAGRRLVYPVALTVLAPE